MLRQWRNTLESTLHVPRHNTAEHSAVRNSSFDLAQVTTGFHPGIRLTRFFPANARGKLHRACCCTCRKQTGGERVVCLFTTFQLCIGRNKRPNNSTTPRTWTGPPRAPEASPPYASKSVVMISSGVHPLRDDRCRLATARRSRELPPPASASG